jgi:hypothetical protein
VVVGADGPRRSDGTHIRRQVGQLRSRLGDPLHGAAGGAVLAQGAHDVPVAARLHGRHPELLAAQSVRTMRSLVK